jgi:hypothetical protein
MQPLSGAQQNIFRLRDPGGRCRYIWCASWSHCFDPATNCVARTADDGISLCEAASRRHAYKQAMLYFRCRQGWYYCGADWVIEQVLRPLERKRLAAPMCHGWNISLLRHSIRDAVVVSC